MLDGPILGVQRLALLPPAEATRVVRHAIAAGVRWFDVADVYGPRPGDAERWLAGVGVPVATKGGLVRLGARWQPDGRARHLEAAAEASRDRLGVEAIELYQLHAPDPRTPFATTLRALGRLVDRGIARRVGLCNVTATELAQALDLVAVASVQVEVGPFKPHAVRSGVVELARERGIPVLAYRPLGGVDGPARLRRDPVLAAIAARHAATVEQVVLAWLAGLGLIPLAGPTRTETVDATLAARSLVLDDDARQAIDARFEPGRIRRPRAVRAARASRADADGDVVIVMGTPGAGKTTRVARYAETHLRLNRDDRGGTLSALAEVLDEALRSGVRRVVLDNTYASRASRNPVIETAWAHGVPVRCEWLTTSDAEAEVNVVHRILDAVGHLPDPDALAALNRTRPEVLPPRALHRYRSELEPPVPDEGFRSIEEIPFVRRSRPTDTRRALLLDPRDLIDARVAAIRARVDDGFVPVVVGWEPTSEPEAIVDRWSTRAARLGFAADVSLCPHPPGPALCWCRKPLPGLAIAALRRLGCDPSRSIALATTPADRAVADKLGIAIHAVPRPAS
ncbi:MAG: aldo/keto reductase [Myxococcota bacterium]